MLKVVKSESRGKTELDWLESYHSFSFGHHFDPENVQFGPIRVLNDDKIAPASGFPKHPHNDMEIITIALDGELTHEDSAGGRGVIRPGEVQRMTAGIGVYHSEFNNSQDKEAHILQIWFIPDKKGYEPSYEQKDYDINKTKNKLLKLVSKKDGDGIVNINQDAELYKSELETDSSINYDLSDQRGIYIYMIDGNLDVNGTHIQKGDALKIENENSIGIKAIENSSFILFDVSLTF